MMDVSHARLGVGVGARDIHRTTHERFRARRVGGPPVTVQRGITMRRWEKRGETSTVPDGVCPAPGTSHGLGASADAAGVAAEVLSPVAAARSHGFGGGGMAPVGAHTRPARKKSVSVSIDHDATRAVPQSESRE